MPSLAEIQRQHQTMDRDQWAASFSPRSSSSKMAIAPQIPVEPVQQETSRVAAAAITPAAMETGTPRLYGMTAQDFAKGFKSVSPEAIRCREIIEEMKKEFDAMEEKLHVVTPLPEVKSKTTEKTASQGCFLFSAIRAVARVIAAVVRVLFCCGLCSSGTKTKEQEPKYAPEVQEYLKTFRAMLDNQTDFMATVKANLPKLNEVEALEKVQSNFRAYALENLNYTQG